MQANLAPVLVFNTFDRPILTSHKAFSRVGSTAQQHCKTIGIDDRTIGYMLDFYSVDLNLIISVLHRIT